MTHSYCVKEEFDPRVWHTQIPNIVDEMGLDPYAFRLYHHLKRVAGDNGDCYQSTATLATACKMGAGTISRAKQDLLDSGLIRVESHTRGGRSYHNITIVDIWKKNYDRFIEIKSESKARSGDEPARSGDETKNNPIKNNIDDVSHHSAEPNDNGDSKNPLAPETEQDLLLFSKFNEQRKAAHRRRCTKFPNDIIRDRFRRAAIRLDGNLENAIDAALLAGIGSLPKLIAYVNKWRVDGQPTTSNQRGKSYEGYSDGYESGSFATGVGESYLDRKQRLAAAQAGSPSQPMSRLQGAGSGQGC